MLECTNGIIGVTRSENACVLQGATDEEKALMATSASGLYIDELPGGLTLKAVKSAADGTVLAKVMLSQINIAQQLTYDAIRLALASKYDSAKPKFEGTIGEYTFANRFAGVGQFAGIRLKSRSKDGAIALRRITLIAGASGVTDVYVIRTKRGAKEGEIVWSMPNVNVTAFAQTNISLPANFILPTYHEYSESDYHILYDTKGGTITAADNKISCNCGDKNARIANFVNATGATYPNLQSFDLPALISEFACGMVLDVQMTCATSNFVCRQYDDREEIAVGLAHAVINKAAECTIEYILKSPEISRFTMQNREYLWGKRNHFKKDFDSFIMYIVNEAKVFSTDCYICKASATNDIRLTPILA